MNNGIREIDEINRIVDYIIRVKNIKISENIFRIRMVKLLKNNNNLIQHKINLRNLYKEKFDSNKQEHVEILFKIWENLKGNRDIQLIDNRWCKTITN